MNDMNDSNNSGDKTLSVPPTKTLSLKRPVEQGVVRQSFSHGRTKAVVVEKVKRRVHGPGETPRPVSSPGSSPGSSPAAPVTVAPRHASPAAPAPSTPAPPQRPAAAQSQSASPPARPPV